MKRPNSRDRREGDTLPLLAVAAVGRYGTGRTRRSPLQLRCFVAPVSEAGERRTPLGRAVPQFRRSELLAVGSAGVAPGCTRSDPQAPTRLWPLPTSLAPRYCPPAPLIGGSGFAEVRSPSPLTRTPSVVDLPVFDTFTSTTFQPSFSSASNVAVGSDVEPVTHARHGASRCQPTPSPSASSARTRRPARTRPTRYRQTQSSDRASRSLLRRAASTCRSRWISAFGGFTSEVGAGATVESTTSPRSDSCSFFALEERQDVDELLVGDLRDTTLSGISDSFDGV